MSPDILRQEIAALDRAEWTTWPHAYGSARDTPGHLTALLDDDHEAQRGAARHFSSAIVHQTSVWPASPDAFAWLVRVLRERPPPDDILEDCLGALAEAGEYLGDVPTGPAPELSREGRRWLRKFGKTPDDEHDILWERFLGAEVNQEVYDWVLARMAGLRPAVADLVTALSDRVPTACDAVRAAWSVR
ncbi:hypothetical protein [Actinophytocola oryzae]|uniref:Uncharacterized protein n=1 Tax=Actinophytocola oryzae TaxID=502181 RepID=A0A4R7VQ91_9PSEU|nr:hypothetical protein [Actinophytocola oryzae]TDV51913.1 hypothetical protein CLV71_10542 [Actinophytocola oryzae]